jgi:hypothetical protein
MAFSSDGGLIPKKRLHLCVNLFSDAAKRSQPFHFATLDGGGVLEGPVNALGARRKYRTVVACVVTDRNHKVEWLATRGIDRWSERCQGARPVLDAAFRANKQVLVELISVASAIRVQSVPDLVLNLAEACRLGATPEMLRDTVGIARSVHNAAMEQIEAVLGGDANFKSTPNGGTLCGPAQGCGCR